MGSLAHFAITFVIGFLFSFSEALFNLQFSIPSWLGMTVAQLEVAGAIAVALLFYRDRSRAEEEHSGLLRSEED